MQKFQENIISITRNNFHIPVTSNYNFVSSHIISIGKIKIYSTTAFNDTDLLINISTSAFSSEWFLLFKKILFVQIIIL